MSKAAGSSTLSQSVQGSLSAPACLLPRIRNNYPAPLYI